MRLASVLIVGTVQNVYTVKVDSYVSDGGAMVSTGVDSSDGSTVGDDRKSSKSSKRKR